MTTTTHWQFQWLFKNSKSLWVKDPQSSNLWRHVSFAHLQSSSIPFPLIGNNLYKSCLVQYVLWGHLLFIANTARIVELIGKVKDTLSEDRILIQSSISFALIQIRLSIRWEDIRFCSVGSDHCAIYIVHAGMLRCSWIMEKISLFTGQLINWWTTSKSHTQSMLTCFTFPN